MIRSLRYAVAMREAHGGSLSGRLVVAGGETALTARQQVGHRGDHSAPATARNTFRLNGKNSTMIGMRCPSYGTLPRTRGYCGCPISPTDRGRVDLPPRRACSDLAQCPPPQQGPAWRRTRHPHDEGPTSNRVRHPGTARRALGDRSSGSYDPGSGRVWGASALLPGRAPRAQLPAVRAGRMRLPRPDLTLTLPAGYGAGS